MNINRLEPLGVPNAGYEFDDSSLETQPRSLPTALDRKLLRLLAGRLDESRVRIALWDEPDTKPAANQAIVKICDRTALWQLLLNPGLHFGDLYSAGRIRVNGDLLIVVDEAYRFLAKVETRWRLLGRSRIQAPTLTDSKRNIHHHYDIGNEFYELWLDREALQYTCAYFAEPTMTIEQAQQAKMHHVCRKLRLEPGETVVEAGGGWGGFAIFMAKNYGARVRSFNISHQQIVYAREWAKREGVDHLAEFVEDDFRNITGAYDVFVSIGMLEHVGAGNYKELGALMSRTIGKQGRGLVHSIGRDRPAPLNAWISKRIFPGAYPPTLREMMDLFEDTGLSVLDVENIRLHYAETCRAWLTRFEENVDTVRTMFDEAFVRAWRLYLAGSLKAFEHGTLQLFQVLFAPSTATNVPWTRAHVYAKGE
jgi:cyclopropane-fatty-acyl-phospholipid synthase